jgi:hypothetical protein
MVVTVVRVSNDSLWYSELIGYSFHVVRYPGNLFYFFSTPLLFYPGDVLERTDSPNAFVPIFSNHQLKNNNHEPIDIKS